MSGRLQLRDIFNEDLDKLFSYKTPMLALIKDRYLGLLKILINLGILVYFVVYVIVLEKAYRQTEFSFGTAIVYTTGTAMTLDGKDVRIWDSVDVAYPQFDPSAVVLTTKVTEQIRQQKSICIDNERPCETSENCLPDYNCIDGYCEEPSWCSSESEKKYSLEGVENFIIWVQGNIDFLTLAPGVEFTTLHESKSVVYPDSGANSYLLSDILKFGDMKYEDLKETGAVIRIKLDWNCDITWSNDCSPNLISERLDNILETPIGFYYDRYFYYTENNEEYRDHLNITGIKIIVESSGKAYAVTINSIIINLSSAINLTMITPRIVDFLMLYVMKNRKEYRKVKFVLTDDFNKDVKEEKTDENNENPLSINDVPEETDKQSAKSEENHFRSNIP